ncbi:MAG: hypothetical protein U0M48_11005, partial [Xylanibacter rarus]
ILGSVTVSTPSFTLAAIASFINRYRPACFSQRVFIQFKGVIVGGQFLFGKILWDVWLFGF